MLITFEGLDGVGKTTQVNMLYDHLVERGVRVVKYDNFSTQVGEQIKKLFVGKDVKMHIDTELLLMYAARNQLVQDEIVPKLNDGYTVLIDRYYHSSYAYQGGRGCNLELLDDLTFTICQRWCEDPDIVFWIDGASRGVSLDLFEKKISADLNNIYNAYFDFYEPFDDIVKIDSGESIGATHDEIVGIYENFKYKIDRTNRPC